MAHPKRPLPTAVVSLGLTSLLTDIASDAIYPLLPVFLATLGAGPAFLGLLEGVAESVASLTKYFSGRYSDRIKIPRGRTRLVLAGYSLSAAARPLIGLAAIPMHVFGARFFDRLGKGIRTAPRDAWIASSVEPSQRGHAFGFHRSMDNAGAAIGPLLAAAFLWFQPGHYRTLFVATAIPGVLSLLFITRAGRTDTEALPTPNAIARDAAPVAVRDVGGFSPTLRAYLALVVLFSLANSSDIFLLLKLKAVGVSDPWLPIAWAALNAVKSAATYRGGAFSDRVGRSRAISLGWVWYGLVYLGFAFAEGPLVVAALFLFYGLHFGLIEGAERAWVAELAPVGRRAEAYGAFHLCIGFTALPASLGFGALWHAYGPQTAFITAATLACIAAGGLSFLRGDARNRPS